jgi:hypothetical protein
MYTYTFLLRMTETMTPHNIDLSSWDTLYIYIYIIFLTFDERPMMCTKKYIYDLIYSRCLERNTGKNYIKLGQERFLSHPFKFNIH